MKPYSRLSRLFALAILVTAFVPILGCPTQDQGQQALLDRVDALEDGLAAVQSELGSAMADLATVQGALAEAQTKLAHMSIEEGALNGLNGPHLIIEGCNIHVRSGSGDTEDAEGLTGLGNLIIGYNELPDPVVHGRLGSHNLVLGSFHEYSSWGGLVAGYHNAVTGRFSSASGGSFNLASGDGSSASGGQNNEASGEISSVSAGYYNVASGGASSVSGGGCNEASVWVSSVSGGGYNVASGTASSVSGGDHRSATENANWAAGSLFEEY